MTKKNGSTANTYWIESGIGVVILMHMKSIAVNVVSYFIRFNDVKEKFIFILLLNWKTRLNVHVYLFIIFRLASRETC